MACRRAALFCFIPAHRLKIKAGLQEVYDHFWRRHRITNIYYSSVPRQNKTKSVVGGIFPNLRNFSINCPRWNVEWLTY